MKIRRAVATVLWCSATVACGGGGDEPETAVTAATDVAVTAQASTTTSEDPPPAAPTSAVVSSEMSADDVECPSESRVRELLGGGSAVVLEEDRTPLSTDEGTAVAVCTYTSDEKGWGFGVRVAAFNDPEQSFNEFRDFVLDIERPDDPESAEFARFIDAPGVVGWVQVNYIGDIDSAELDYLSGVTAAVRNGALICENLLLHGSAGNDGAELGQDLPDVLAILQETCGLPLSAYTLELKPIAALEQSPDVPPVVTDSGLEGEFGVLTACDEAALFAVAYDLVHSTACSGNWMLMKLWVGQEWFEVAVVDLTQEPTIVGTFGDSEATPDESGYSVDGLMELGVPGPEARVLHEAMSGA